MPMMAYLAVDEPRQLTRSDYVRLGLVTGGGETVPGSETALPYAEQDLADFEQQFCYDRFWVDSGAAPNTRYLCSGLSLIVVGDEQSTFYRCRDRGVLAQFRHQHFLLFLIAHFQKASLLMMSDQLAEALTALDVTQPSSVKRFKRQIRRSYVSFLAFTHRYWFHEVSEQAHVKALFHLCTRHLKTDGVYDEVKERIRDMNSYLDADSLRRQANTVVRLTVVTILGLVGTITTGFLGMNLLAAADAPLVLRSLAFVAVMALTVALTLYTIAKSKRLSDFLDIVSDERVPGWSKLESFFAIWTTPADALGSESASRPPPRPVVLLWDVRPWRKRCRPASGWWRRGWSKRHGWNHPIAGVPAAAVCAQSADCGDASANLLRDAGCRLGGCNCLP
jgi:hypothetical protein